jgi:UDP-N-acetylglucosamine acyltransferase
VCGPENVFREHVTVSRGSLHGGGETRLGAGNLLMAGVHIGHDCRLGDGNTLANNVSLAGHVEVGDRVGIGGHAAVHQFVRLGTLCFVAANAMVAQDVPPGCLAAGDRARLHGLNVTGLRRAFVPPAVRQAWHRAFRRLCLRRGGDDGSTELDALRHFPEVAAFIEFVQASPRGICRAVGRADGDPGAERFDTLDPDGCVEP